MKWLPINPTKEEKEAFKKASASSPNSKKLKITAIIYAVMMIAGIILLIKHYYLLLIFLGIMATAVTTNLLALTRGAKNSQIASPAAKSAAQKIENYLAQEENKKATPKQVAIGFLIVLGLFLILIGGIIFYILVIKR